MIKGEWWECVEVRESGKVRLDTLKDGVVVKRSEEYDEADVLAIMADLWSPAVFLRDKPKDAATLKPRKPYESLRDSRW